MKNLSILMIILIFISAGKSQNMDVKNLITFPNLGDASSKGLGGIFTVINKGSESLNGNPAGLARSHTAQISATNRITIWGTNDFTNDYYNDKNYQDYSSKLKFYPKLLNLSLSVPLKISGFKQPLTGAIGYRTIYDVSYKFSSKYLLNNVKTEKNNKIQGFLNSLTLGMATKFKNKYYFGFSLNFPFWDGYNEQHEERLTSDAFASLKKTKMNWDIDGGTFIQLGFIGELTRKIVLGLNYMSSHSYKLRNGKWVINHDGTINSGNNKHIIKYSIPSIYTLGIYYKLKPNFATAMEIQNCPWENVEINGASLLNVESGMAYRFGVEYSKNYNFRLGFQLQRLPLIDSNLDPVNLKSLTFGLNVPFDNFNLDISSTYNFTNFDQREGDQNWDYKIKQWTIFTTIKYYFDYKINL